MQSNEDISSRELLWMSIFSLLFYFALSYLIFHFIRAERLQDAFAHGFSWPFQLGYGLLCGAAAALAIGFFVNREPLRSVLDDFYIFREVSRMRLTPFDRIQVSLFAGAGEELLFRGALQPVLGIWLTSLVFVGIHGYFKFKSIGHILFGLLMFALSMLLGSIYAHAGLLSAMAAHAFYDVIMLWWIKPTGDGRGSIFNS